jgi:two-component system, NarL family, response regulator LiaR
VAAKIRVLLDDDHQMFREGVRQVLTQAGDIEVVGEAGDGTTAVRKAAELKPDVVLMDLNMPGMDGIGAIQQLAQRQIETRVIVLTMHRGDKALFEALRAGAHAYILKDSSTADLLRAIREVKQGLSPLDPAISSRVLSEFRRLAGQREPTGLDGDLTEREAEVLRLVGSGLSNKEIAARLCLAEKTVKNYLTTIFQKLHLNDRVQAALYAQKHGLLPESEG